MVQCSRAHLRQRSGETLRSGLGRAEGMGPSWQDYLLNTEADIDMELEKCTYAGRPFGDPEFVARIGDRFDRQWTRRRPKKKPDPVVVGSDVQGSLFTG